LFFVYEMPDDFPACVDVEDGNVLFHEFKDGLRRELSIATDNYAVNQANGQATEYFGIFFNDNARTVFMCGTARR